MHKRILSEAQIKLLSLVKSFSHDFGLVGGTAVALYLGHRRSIDFDLFTTKSLQTEGIKKKIRTSYTIDQLVFESGEEMTLIVNGVKLTFLKYPFPIHFTESFDNFIRLPSLPTLIAMKAYALGKRSKWKDYVDIYFFLKSNQLSDIVSEAQKIFGTEFSEKLFRVQLSYFQDIDYSEQIDFMPGFEVSNQIIKDTLTKLSVQM